MQIIGSVIEDLSKERRISITPETAKKLVSLGFVVNVEKNYAAHLGIDNKDYEKSNKKFLSVQD